MLLHLLYKSFHTMSHFRKTNVALDVYGRNIIVHLVVIVDLLDFSLLCSSSVLAVGVFALCINYLPFSFKLHTTGLSNKSHQDSVSFSQNKWEKAFLVFCTQPFNL